MESLPTYYFSLFKAPQKVIDGLEGIIRRFLWGGSNESSKINWVAWDRVASPVQAGGLGLHKLLESNVALLSKWSWRYLNEPNGLWRKVIDAIHDTKRRWASIPFNSSVRGVWHTIVKALMKVKISGKCIISMFKGVYGDGRNIRFWLDSWACNNPFKDEFPILFKKDRNKKCRVSDIYSQDLNCFAGLQVGNRTGLSGAELDEWQRLNGILENLQPTGREDRWDWIGRKGKPFSVKEVRVSLNQDKDYSDRFVFKWSKWTPNKCNIFMWRVGMSRIPTLAALRKRNCLFESTICGLCEQDEETTEHLFCSCVTSMEVWQRISQWCKLPPVFFFDVKDLFKVQDQTRFGKDMRSVLKGISFVTCWCIWRARNEKIFNGGVISTGKIFEDVRTLSFLWYRVRRKRVSLTWKNWCNFVIN